MHGAPAVLPVLHICKFFEVFGSSAKQFLFAQVSLVIVVCGIHMIDAHVLPPDGPTGRPELDMFVNKWLQDNTVLSQLTRIPLSERIRIVAAAQNAMQQQRLRAGVDTYIAGCIRRYDAACAAYPNIASASSPKTSMPVICKSPPKSPARHMVAGLATNFHATIGHLGKSTAADILTCDISSRASSSDTQTRPRSPRTPPPSWATEAFALSDNRTELCRSVAARLGEQTSAALASIPPKRQHILSAAAVVIAVAWTDLDAAIQKQIDNFKHFEQTPRMKSMPTTAAQVSSVKLMVLAWGSVLGQVPLAVGAAVRALEGKHSDVKCDVEVHEIPADALSARCSSLLAERTEYSIYLHTGGAQLKAVIQAQSSRWCKQKNMHHFADHGALPTRSFCRCLSRHEHVFATTFSIMSHGHVAVSTKQ